MTLTCREWDIFSYCCPVPATVTSIEVERGSFPDKTFLHKNYLYTYDFILASVSFAVDIYSQDCKRKCQACTNIKVNMDRGRAVAL
jgi:hypothetical protein